MEEITEFLSPRSRVYVDLDKLRKEVWLNSQADKYFQNQQETADNAGPKLKNIFYKMMHEIAKDMDRATQFITHIEVRRKSIHRAPPPKVLDLCMAPGGFSDRVRQSLSPLAVMNGITLPQSLGGHELLLENSTRLKVEYLDITMLVEEMGFAIADIPLDHPDYNSFLSDRPFFNQTYDLILADGQVLRTHKRHEYREKTEGLRLAVSQLIFAMQHIKSGGSFIMLLHKSDTPRIMDIIHKCHKFSSSVRLYKPIKYHAMRSSFYIYLEGVNPYCTDALRAIKEWKKDWASCTFGAGEEPQISDDNVRDILVDFGEKFIAMCEPIWKIQCDALSRKLKSGF